ncbi:hypothetical protein GMAR_ORF116 [Golden Marseillevirus]|uniref:hypothetical protein n=1 Tax=Golden Marseillevirus TaxID=1720526 RepID=UPI000877AEFE|nr:hypothetical protein GMAR_ORF116 [Golden Marseillevirus]ALX27490.1 hypothetical protein GMAR_ORF116 [Golden Marseillevirus]
MNAEKVQKVHRLQEILKERNAKNKRIKEEIERIRLELFSQLDQLGENSLKEQGKIIFSRTKVNVKSVDTKRLIEENPELAKKYERVTKSWRVNWRKIKEK